MGQSNSTEATDDEVVSGVSIAPELEGTTDIIVDGLLLRLF